MTTTQPKRFFSFCLSLVASLLLTAVAVAQLPESQEDNADPSSDQFEPPHRETILSYDSDIHVAENGKLTVTTTIQVWAMGKDIKRGIYRKFPVRYTGRYQQRVHVPFEVLSVKRDGHPEPYHIKTEGAYKVLYMGQEDRRLKKNQVYTYQFTYQTDRQLGYFEDFDELYWNVNGNEWTFPIDKISATVTLPKKVSEDLLRIEGYTGPKGAKGKEFRSWVDEEGRIHFETTKPLPSEQGLTIAVGFPKGIVQPPSKEQELKWFLSDNGGLLAGTIAILFVFFYYSFAWLRVGRDPTHGVIYPRYTPPKFNNETLSPSAVAYCSKMKADQRCVTAAMINYAVRGGMTIDEDGGSAWTGKTYTLRKNGGETLDSVSEREKKAFDRLFGSAKTIKVAQTNHTKFQSFKKNLFEGLKRDFCGQGKLFVLNTNWFICGIFLSIGAILFTLLGEFLGSEPERIFISMFLSVWLSVWTIGVVALLRGAIGAWRNVASRGLLMIGSAICATLFAIPFLIGEVMGIGFLFLEGSPMLGVLIVVLGILNYFFYTLLKQPTREGARVRDEIEGFKNYLETAEEDDLRRLTLDLLDEEDLPKIFETYLPYAIALGVELTWIQRFEHLLQAAEMGTDGYRPVWYHGSTFDPSVGKAFTGRDLSLALGGLAGGFGSAISSAGTSPGSSSGSGGGGSSGGGSGGGGGGGW